MSRTKNTHTMCNIGPAIPIVPFKDFTKGKFLKEHVVEMWTIIGPSISHNIDKMPLWQVVTMAYMEGLLHGYGIGTEGRSTDIDGSAGTQTTPDTELHSDASWTAETIGEY